MVFTGEEQHIVYPALLQWLIGPHKMVFVLPRVQIDPFRLT